jgi:rhodanese-related sulfurtransferase
MERRPQKVKSVDKKTLKSWLGRPDLFLMDVRSPRAFDKSIAKIEQAHRIEPAQLLQVARNIAEGKRVVLYCENGKTQCPNLAQELEELGFSEVYVLEGGWQVWSGKEYPAVPKELIYG